MGRPFSARLRSRPQRSLWFVLAEAAQLSAATRPLPTPAALRPTAQDRVTTEMCPWYNGPSLFEILDNLEPQDRNKDAPFRMPILDKHKDMGTVRCALARHRSRLFA